MKHITFSHVTTAILLCGAFFLCTQPGFAVEPGNLLDDIANTAEDVGRDLGNGVRDVLDELTEDPATTENNAADRGNPGASADSSANHEGSPAARSEAGRSEDADGDGIVGNSRESGTLGDAASSENSGTNWAVIWIAVILAMALIAVIVALIPKRSNR